MVKIVQSLKIHNTLSGKKEEFEPLDKNHVKIYACGPTVYNFAHIGNARMAAHHIGSDVHHMGIALNDHLLGDLNAASLTNATHIVAA